MGCINPYLQFYHQTEQKKKRLQELRRRKSGRKGAVEPKPVDTSEVSLAPPCLCLRVRARCPGH